MKIAVVGTHSTGKTTLIRSYVERNKNTKFHAIPEVASRVIEAGFPMGKDGNADSYIRYLNEQLKAELAAEKFDWDILFADRTILDGAAYPKVNKNLPRPYLSNDLVDLFFNILRFQKSYYDLYVYLPLEFPMTRHVNRPDDEAYRRAIDFEVHRTLEDEGVNYLTLTGNIDQRCDDLHRHISSSKN